MDLNILVVYEIPDLQVKGNIVASGLEQMDFAFYNSIVETIKLDYQNVGDSPVVILNMIKLDATPGDNIIDYDPDVHLEPDDE